MHEVWSFQERREEFREWSTVEDEKVVFGCYTVIRFDSLRVLSLLFLQVIDKIRAVDLCKYLQLASACHDGKPKGSHCKWEYCIGLVK